MLGTYCTHIIINAHIYTYIPHILQSGTGSAQEGKSMDTADKAAFTIVRAPHILYNITSTHMQETQKHY